MPRNTRGGYRMWAKSDRCAADYDLRHVRRNIAAGEQTLTDVRQQLATETDERTIARLKRRIEVADWAIGVARQNETRLIQELDTMFQAKTPCNETAREIAR